ncbi:hypothetical protein BOTBODRAFT_50154 [Botryobasidium botryosum FD-172 SS1]|uniref:Uncharacterized protein n=1 Tax=Botryobasidium botryosum (strain FD-172 SS1) TaxID=930990 RepID=A0A067N3I0_BOTB1|nr:hypothetical protein BOTBODRAFT_50154 [Botryobasidium botryosum FD-172 SS1]
MASSAAAGREPLDIDEDEAYWVKRQPFFESRTTSSLSDWMESWAKPRGIFAESAITATVSHFLTDEHNHCVSLLDAIDPGDGSKVIYLVLLLLLYFDGPKFGSGLAFMYKKGVARRGCTHFNIMMNHKYIYPEGVHPQRLSAVISDKGSAPPRCRYQTPFRKYYIINPGLSARYPEGFEGPRLVSGLGGQGKTVPETVQGDAAYRYDRFNVEIYTLGSLHKNEPLAVPVLNVLGHLFSLSLYRRLTPVDEGVLVELMRNGLHLTRRALSR